MPRGERSTCSRRTTSDESYCSGKCAKVWPPYTTKGGPKAGKGAEASKLGTLKRDDGSTQVTYNGSPLYLYVSDKQAGDASGNELDQFGAEWYALRPSGDKAEGDEPAGEQLRRRWRRQQQRRWRRRLQLLARAANADWAWTRMTLYVP